MGGLGPHINAFTLLTEWTYPYSVWTDEHTHNHTQAHRTHSGRAPHLFTGELEAEGGLKEAEEQAMGRQMNCGNSHANVYPQAT